ncbi:SCO family protein [Accumulibacter sp.]|uniref:SCO family protein n=1 Tax=Accumulibacter sp. TaxID=2053492 RepID=UPI0025FB06FF|nr:SCO family protein [Accumulibacter sp.]MCM8593949.1 SCO family protein [Accumulibacter sp.]MCM8627798.1 SCO family protein [Accumulibacter sp.]MDS4048090.1 SCO family protein [Accumulibacter sp.]
MNKDRTWLILSIAGLALSLAAAVLIWHSLPGERLPALDPRQSRLASATLLDDSRPLPPFSLLREHGGFTNGDLAGRWTLLFFGYTFCPDVCPTTLLLLREVKTRLVAAGVAPAQVVMISVDPDRDLPETLTHYTRAFDPEFIGATGDDDSLRALVSHLGVYYLRHAEGKKSAYLVDHSAAIYLIDPQGRLKAVFSPPQNVDGMVGDLLTLIR